MAVNNRAPVVVGVHQIKQRPDDPTEAVEAIALMIEAVKGAAADAGAPSLLSKLGLVAVVDGAWKYSDPGRLIADAVGAGSARTGLSANGGNSPQSLVNLIGNRIQAGELDAAVITGAEIIWSRRRQRRAGHRADYVVQEGVAPDEQLGLDVPMSSDFESARGMDAPINYYPVFESAIRAARGETLDQHRDRLAELWARFNRVAVDNEYAWFRTPMTADEIRNPSPSNRMVGYPYTKAMNSNWDLDQSAAILLCAAEVAEAAGVPKDRWVFPRCGTDAHDTYLVSERRDLHSSPAITEAGARLFDLGGVGVDDVDHIDIYSCFPSAVQVAADSLGIDQARQLTQTGGLTFAGGPLNNYVSHSIATMVDVLRDDAGSLGPGDRQRRLPDQARPRVVLHRTADGAVPSRRRAGRGRSCTEDAGGRRPHGPGDRRGVHRDARRRGPERGPVRAAHRRRRPDLGPHVGAGRTRPVPGRGGRRSGR